ncbi:MAG: CoB--CoM heterodisulfide reductase iron-sulfur subunit A family protein [Halioglobus sp.]|nr:CoB--CoM heterodisulfide reductase iron-sulfur subunit A family protein [Halioglobus sp.]
MSATILILGGGPTGLRAAAEVASAGSRAVVLEQLPVLGGKRAAMLTGPDAPDPELVSVTDNPAVSWHTQSQLVALTGEAGHFTATVTEQPRYVTADCTRCNHCVPVCPQVVPNEYDAGLTYRKAIHSPLPKTLPDIYSIDIDSCLNGPPNYLPCERCTEACDDDAIHFDMPVPPPRDIEVASVIVATGFAGSSEEEGRVLAEFGYGTHPDIVSGREMQRLLEDPGPSGGFAVKPSDESYPDAVVLVLTAPTADTLWVAQNHVRRLAAQQVESLAVLVLSADSEDPALASLRDAAAECAAPLYFGGWIAAQALEEGGLEVAFAALPGGTTQRLDAELVALYTEVRPDPATAALAALLGVEQDTRGYLAPTRPGIYLAGGASGTVGIEAGFEEAATVVQSALQHVTARKEQDEEATPPRVPQLRREDLEQLLHALLELGRSSAR